MAKEYTFEELQAQGAQPSDELTFEELQKMGAIPAPEPQAAMDMPSDAEVASLKDAVLRSGADSVLFGHLPQVQAGVESMGGADFDARQKEIADLLQSDQQRFPISTGLAGLAGGLATGGALGKVGAGLMGAAKPVATARDMASQTALSSMIFGALQNPGDVDDPLSARLDAATTSAAMGYGAGGLFGKVLSKAGRQSIKDAAGERGFKALGPYSREARKAYSKGRVSEIGQAALDEGVIGNIPRGYDTLAKRAETAKHTVGKQKQAVVDEIEDLQKRLAAQFSNEGNLPIKAANAQAKQVIARAGVDRRAIAEALETDLMIPDDIPGAERVNRSMRKLIEEFKNHPNPVMPIKDADGLKMFLGDKKNGLINWDRLPGADIPLQEKFYRSLYAKLNQGVDDAAQAVAGQADEVLGGNIKMRLQSTKKRYGAVADAERIASRREGQEIANRLVSPSDYFSGVSGAVGSMVAGVDPMTSAAIGAAAGGANKIARRYGNQVAAKQLDNLRRILDKFNAGPGTSAAIGGVSASARGQKDRKTNRRLKALEE